MFANATLAARIERAECGMLTELTDAAAARRGHDAVFAARVAGGIAAFTGPGSPANKFAGLGFDGVPSAADLDRVERAFAERGAPLQVEFSSLGDPAVPRLLTARGYELIGFENVLGRPLNLAELEAEDGEAIAIERVGADAASTWMDVVATGFLNPDTFDGPPSHESIDRDAMGTIFGDTIAAPSFERYLARRGTAAAGGASLRLQDGVAQLAGAATVPEHRRNGVQTALLRFRLLAAARRGCDIAVVTTQPGSKSAENVERFGFAILYVRAILIKQPHA
jgi:GNAT superfamily N-acetyltransferase